MREMGPAINVAPLGPAATKPACAGCCARPDPSVVSQHGRCREPGAGLDVFEREPLPPESRLWECDNVIITAHQAFLTREALAAIARTTLDNISAWAAGRPCNQVDA